MSAYVDAQTPGGYTGTSDPEPQRMTHQNTGSTGGDGSWWQSLVGNAVNRYMDVETWKQTQGQMPPNYYTAGNNGRGMQGINTGTQNITTSTVAGVPVWVLAVGAVALLFALKK
jgi:hypothetical protein